MIKRAKVLPIEFSGDIQYARIKAIFNTYGDNAEIYIAEANGEVTAVMGSAGGSGFTLCAKETADFSELQSFFSFRGAEVFCDFRLADRFQSKRRDVSVLELCDFEKTEISHSKISDVYKVLEYGNDGDIELPEFSLWYTDFCLRFNHLAAEYACLENAAAVCGFMTDEQSLITGVAVMGGQRGKGLGKKAIMSLCTAIKEKYEGSRIFAAVSEDNLNFYLKCGFKKVDSAAILNF